MQQTATVSRTSRSPRDLVISMVVLLVPIFLFVGVYRLLGHDNPPVVDTSGSFREARAAAFPALSPTPLPGGWHALSSDFRAGQPASVLRVGLRAPGGGVVQLVESSQDSESLVADELGAKARGQGEVDVAGSTWRRYAGERGLRALVLVEAGRSVIIVGSAKDKELVQLAGALA